MRLFLLTLLSLLFGRFANAQETTVIISDSNYTGTVKSFNISGNDAWVFRRGDIKDGQNVNLDTKGWKKFKPSELSGEDFDENGRFEGWFRIKVRFADSPNFTPPGVLNATWNASELFANGKKIATFGKFGADKATFEENKFNRRLPVPTNFVPDSTYVLALHVVEYDDPFTIEPKLKKGNNNADILRFINKEGNERIIDYWASQTFYDGLRSTVSATFALLFWVLFGLNRREKNIRRFAVGCTFLALLSIASAIATSKNIGYVGNASFGILGIVAAVSYACYIPIILAGVFERKISKFTRIVMIVTYLVLVGAAILQYGIVLTLVVIPLVIACYYLLSSWNSMRRSQMPIVVGFLASFICLILFVLGVNYLDKFDSAIIFVLAYSISPPLGMLMYVSNRFGEMIKEVRTNAQQVLQLSEEKREQALNQQKVLEAEVDKQTAELRNTLSDLKATQSQLIQSEKMASLGELTAGIAHEIQNPLNFVNNFSDVSRELIAEVSDERRKTNDERDDELVNELLSDIDQNLEKISHHGRRADAIVKGMLQHSRSTSGDMEPTDLNALADEYLRLAYHGLRAKDKSFNAELITDFATDLPVVKVIPQDVGRVILNLITNAFYATQERAKSEGVDFKPKVEVSTSIVGNTVEIKVKDNGNGIPEAIKEKIFQPFFTTKPTGEGTGLGLSLAYDIIKSHGGELGLTSKDGEFTEFTITFHQLI